MPENLLKKSIKKLRKFKVKNGFWSIKNNL